MGYLFLGLVVFAILPIGIIAQLQKRRRQPFYAAPQRDDFAETEHYGGGTNGL